MSKDPAFGVFTRDQAYGAWPNGSRVRKAAVHEGDAHQVGALATVIGSVGPLDHPVLGLAFAYFVEWDDVPGVAVLIANHSGRLELVRRGPAS